MKDIQFKIKINPIVSSILLYSVPVEVLHLWTRKRQPYRCAKAAVSRVAASSVEALAKLAASKGAVSTKSTRTQNQKGQAGLLPFHFQ